MAPLHSPKKCHLSNDDWSTQLPTCLLCHCMPLYLPRHCTVVRLVQSDATSALYEQYNHQILPVWPNEQIMTSFAYDVCLSMFKLCWVCINEVYTHVHFEFILSTLIFRPSWTHFGFGIQSGSHLPTKDLLVLQKDTNQSSSVR
jgi:hypothetical protein